MADGSLVFDTKIDSSGFKSGVSSLGNIGKAGLAVVNGAMIATAGAIAGIGAASIKVGSDFEAAMSQVGAISGATETQMESLSKTAKELGATTSFSASEAAEGMSFLAMAGFEVEEIMESMPGLLDLAAASGMELGAAADITSNIMSGFGIAAKDSGKVADVLAKAASSANTDVAQLGDAMKFVAPAASGLGISMEDTAAAIGVLSDAGIQGGMAGTTLRAGLLRLAKPTGAAASTIKDLGIEVFDAAGNMKDLPSVVGELEKGLEGMTAQQKTAALATMFGTEAVSGWSALLDRGSESLGEFSNELVNSGGTASEMASKMLDNLQGDMTLLKSAMEGVGIEIYESLVGPLREATQFANGWTSALAGLLQGQEGWRESLIESTGATGDFKKQIEEMPEGAEGAAQLFGMFLSNMFSEISSRLPEIAKKGLELIKSFADSISNNSGEMGEAIGDIITTLIGVISQMYPIFIETGSKLLVSIIDGMLKNLPNLIKTILTAIRTIMDSLGEMLPQFLESGKEIITQIVNGLAELAPDLVTFIIEAVMNILTAIVEVLPIILEAGGSILKTLLEGIIELIPMIIDVAIQIIQALVQFISDNLSEVVTLAITVLETLITAILENLPLLIGAAIELILAIVGAILDNLGPLLEAALSIIITIVEALLTNIDLLIDGAIKLLIGIADGLIKNMNPLLKAAIKIVGEIVKGLIKEIPRLQEATDEIIDKLKQWFKDVEWIELGKDIIRGIWDGLKSMDKWLQGKAVEVATGLFDGIKGFFGIKSPSRLMRDEIGENLTLGIGVGIEGGMPDLLKLIKKDMPDVVGTIDAVLNSGQYGIGSAGANFDLTDNNVSRDSGINENGGVIYTSVQIDGREVANATTPYVSENLDVARRRRKR